MFWALLRSVKHHIKTNLHLIVSGEFRDTSSQSKVRRDRVLFFIYSNVHSSDPFWDNRSCNNGFVSSCSQSKHEERYQSSLLPLKGISTEMKRHADGGIKAAGPPTGGESRRYDCCEILNHFWPTVIGPVKLNAHIDLGKEWQLRQLDNFLLYPQRWVDCNLMKRNKRKSKAVHIHLWISTIKPLFTAKSHFRSGEFAAIIHNSNNSRE